MTGESVTFINSEETDIMSVGFAHLEDGIINVNFDQTAFKAKICEPLVIEADYNFFKDKQRHPFWHKLLVEVDFNAAMSGIIWERCVMHLIFTKWFNSNVPLVQQQKLFEDH